MKNLSLVIVVLTMMFQSCSIPKENDDISLIGKWEGSYKVLVNRDGNSIIGDAHMTLNINEISDGFVFANQRWVLNKDYEGVGEIAGKVVREGAEELLGLIKYDESKIIFLETQDNGNFDVIVVDNNTLHAYYTEKPPMATAFRVVLNRISN